MSGKTEKARKDLDAALGLDPKNLKLRLRRAKAYAGRREYELAVADLDWVKECEPWNWEAEEELKRLKRQQKQDLAQDRELAGNVFG